MATVSPIGTVSIPKLVPTVLHTVFIYRDFKIIFKVDAYL